MWRLEVSSPRGQRERAFLHVITASPAKAELAPARRLSGDGLRGALGRADGKSAAVLFVAADHQNTDSKVALGGAVDTIVVAGLQPGRRYAISVDAGSCTLRVAATRGPADPSATSGGFVRLDAAQCGQR
jgi:hypothetical protein